jgi:Tfp pilus assembly protein PilF
MGTTGTIINGLTKAAQKGAADENTSHHADGELASAYLMIEDYDKALQHALSEYNRRPKNIDVNETVAWIYYKKGTAQKALPFIETALRTECKNPTLLTRAGLILAKNNQPKKAKHLL